MSTYDILNGSVPITNLSNVDMSDLEAVKALAQRISAQQGEDATISVVNDDVQLAASDRPVALFYNGREVDPEAFLRGDDLS